MAQQAGIIVRHGAGREGWGEYLVPGSGRFADKRPSRKFRGCAISRSGACK
jgi:hypothetical protein